MPFNLFSLLLKHPIILINSTSLICFGAPEGRGGWEEIERASFPVPASPRTPTGTETI